MSPLLKVFVVRCEALILLALLGFAERSFSAEPKKPTTNPRSSAIQSASSAITRGDFSRAITDLRRFLHTREGNSDPAQFSAARIKLAEAEQALGLYERSVETLEVLSPTGAHALRTTDALDLPAIQNLLGAAHTFLHNFSEAEHNLNSALAAAQRLAQPEMEAAILINTGNLYAIRGEHQRALDAYLLAEQRVKSSSNSVLAAKASLNSAQCALLLADSKRAEELNQNGLNAVAVTPNSHEKAFMYLAGGQNFVRLSTNVPARQREFQAAAIENYTRALGISRAIQDARAESWAYGYLGEVREKQGDFSGALGMTRKALFAAQPIAAADCAYRWEWQAGRLYAKLGNINNALRAYRRAVQDLEATRNDLVLGRGNLVRPLSFREATGGLYFELASLLLQNAEQQRDGASAQILFREARATIEHLRSAELEDYFRDECASVGRAKASGIDVVEPRTAVIYFFTLPDRTVLLLSLNGAFKAYNVAVPESELSADAFELRQLLETRTNARFLRLAQKLYQSLISPLLDDLRKANTQTLVFLPDGALRQLPLAALHDRERFLVEEFSVAVSPGLSLLSPEPLARERSALLLGGLSEAVRNFEALDFVRAELSSIDRAYEGKILLDKQFNYANLSDELRNGRYGLVHLASHGQFGKEAADSFIVLYDRELNLNELERLIRPGQYRGQPVELLALSACETAAGDDRAALGLGGIAVKAGARSALATLWSVHDEAAALLISEFYKQLKLDPRISKARAMQIAQLKLLQDERFNHPYYWSPFLVIGNWL